MDEKFLRCKNLMVRKNGKYDSSPDTLETFKDEASFLHEDPLYRCFSHMIKHITILKSVAKRRNKTSTGGRDLSGLDILKIVESSTDDIVNYVGMMEALLKDEL